VDPHKVLQTGATQIWTAFPSAAIPGILHSYLDGLHLVFILAIALGGASFIAGLFASNSKLDMGRVFGIKAKKEEEEEEEEKEKK
jgi:hypothetical protein